MAALSDRVAQIINPSVFVPLPDNIHPQARRWYLVQQRSHQRAALRKADAILELIQCTR